ncbi:hypothetical protein [Domibacillus indicus]|uniref:hypothetical protein n=1 Tax=Domibacillus indicus TaxID=1437523 RepID=UPI0006181502
MLFFLIKILGRKLINQFTLFPFICAIVLSELLGNAIYNRKMPITYIFYCTYLGRFALINGIAYSEIIVIKKAV